MQQKSFTDYVDMQGERERGTKGEISWETGWMAAL